MNQNVFVRNLTPAESEILRETPGENLGGGTGRAPLLPKIKKAQEIYLR